MSKLINFIKNIGEDLIFFFPDIYEFIIESIPINHENKFKYYMTCSEDYEDEDE